MEKETHNYLDIIFDANDNFKENVKQLKKQNKNIVISINDVNKLEVINIINSLHIYGLKIKLTEQIANKDEIINNLTFLLENLDANIKVFEMPFKKEVKQNLNFRKTYQGFNKSILNYVRREILEIIKKDDYVIDATVGNGNDTLFLATLVSKGKVFGYDIQKEAIGATKIKVKDYHNVYLYWDSHENMLNLKLDKKVKIILFNLGYLPNGNKNITTKASSTLKALNNGLKILNPNGKILIVIYPGHAEGNKEQQEILNWLKTNNYPYQIKRNTENPIAPFLVIIQKS